jgi:hypothetical protein
LWAEFDKGKSTKGDLFGNFACIIRRDTPIFPNYISHLEVTMFDKLKAIDWQSLNASKLPDWIVGLTSPDKDIYSRSYGNLQRYLWHHVDAPSQYEIVLATDAPVLATPFFVELLNHPQTRKGSILYLLEILSRYSGEDELKEPYSIRANQIYQVLLSHFDLYVPFLDSENSNERVHTIYLLGHFAEKSAFVVEQLLTRIENQKEPDELGKRSSAEVIFRAMQKRESLAAQVSNRFIRVMQLWASEETLPV